MKKTFSLVIILFLASISCKAPANSKGREVKDSGPGAPVNNEALVDAAWKKNERIVEAALNGSSSEEGFLSACIFFKELTGIEMRGQGTFVGWLPTEETKDDFRLVQDWYRANKSRLYWDSTLKKVRVLPEKGSSHR